MIIDNDVNSIRPNKKRCLCLVTCPTLRFGADPKLFFKSKSKHSFGERFFMSSLLFPHKNKGKAIIIYPLSHLFCKCVVSL
jgi:hypothetical protein